MAPGVCAHTGLIAQSSRRVIVRARSARKAVVISVPLPSALHPAQWCHREGEPAQIYDAHGDDALSLSTALSVNVPAILFLRCQN